MFDTKKMDAVKIEIRKTQRYGGSKRQVVVIPEVFVRDNNIVDEDELEIYRTNYNGADALIIVPLKTNGKYSTADIVNDKI